MKVRPAAMMDLAALISIRAAEMDVAVPTPVAAEGRIVALMGRDAVGLSVAMDNVVPPTAVVVRDTGAVPMEGELTCIVFSLCPLHGFLY